MSQSSFYFFVHPFIVFLSCSLPSPLLTSFLSFWLILSYIPFLPPPIFLFLFSLFLLLFLFPVLQSETNSAQKYKGVHFGKMTGKRDVVKVEAGPGPGQYYPEMWVLRAMLENWIIFNFKWNMNNNIYCHCILSLNSRLMLIRDCCWEADEKINTTFIFVQ